MKKKSARTASTVSRSNVSMLAGEEMNSFLVHLVLYLLFNFGLFVYIYSRSENMSVFYLVVGGWGIGVVAHALSVLGFMKFLSKKW